MGLAEDSRPASQINFSLLPFPPFHRYPSQGHTTSTWNTTSKSVFHRILTISAKILQNKQVTWWSFGDGSPTVEPKTKTSSPVGGVQIALVGALVVKTYTSGEMEWHASENGYTSWWPSVRYWKSTEEIVTLRTVEVTSEEWWQKRSPWFLPLKFNQFEQV